MFADEIHQIRIANTVRNAIIVAHLDVFRGIMNVIEHFAAPLEFADFVVVRQMIVWSTRQRFDHIIDDDAARSAPHFRPFL